MSDQYGVRDAACPISTGGGGGCTRLPRADEVQAVDEILLVRNVLAGADEHKPEAGPSDVRV